VILLSLLIPISLTTNRLNLEQKVIIKFRIFFNVVQPPRRKTIKSLYQKFHSTESVADLPLVGRHKSVRTEENIKRVRESVNADQSTSLRKGGQELFKTIQIQFTHHMPPSDAYKRLQFANSIDNLIGENENFIDKLIMTDEAHFQPNGYSTENPRIVVEKALYSKKLLYSVLLPQKEFTDLFYFEDKIKKDRVYRNKPETIEDLKNNIECEIDGITHSMLKRVMNSFYKRVQNIAKKKEGFWAIQNINLIKFLINSFILKMFQFTIFKVVILLPLLIPISLTTSRLSLKQRIMLVELYIRNNYKVTKTQRDFQIFFNLVQSPRRGTIQKLYRKYHNNENKNYQYLNLYLIKVDDKNIFRTNLIFIFRFSTNTEKIMTVTKKSNLFTSIFSIKRVLLHQIYVLIGKTLPINQILVLSFKYKVLLDYESKFLLFLFFFNFFILLFSPFLNITFQTINILEIDVKNITIVVVEFKLNRLCTMLYFLTFLDNSHQDKGFRNYLIPESEAIVYMKKQTFDYNIISKNLYILSSGNKEILTKIILIKTSSEIISRMILLLIQCVLQILQYVLEQQKMNEEVIQQNALVLQCILFINHIWLVNGLDLRTILYEILPYDINKDYIEMVSNYHSLFQIEVLLEHQKILEKVVNKSKSLQKNDIYSILADVNTNEENCKIKSIIMFSTYYVKLFIRTVLANLSSKKYKPIIFLICSHFHRIIFL
uniref:Uncharacterized protein n=1 Tax=Strongyloides stercoralis TaxID=6248 RepID=A0AAF5I2M1_STRER